MKKNILIINSGEDIVSLFDFFDELAAKGNDFYFFESGEKELKKIKEKKWNYKKIKQKKKNFCSLILLFWPFISLKWFFSFLYFKYKKNIKHIVLFGEYEKIMLTFVAKLLKIKVVWVDVPSQNIKQSKKIIRKFLVFLSRFATLVTFNNLNKQRLKDVGFKNIHIINLGVKLLNKSCQDNIFNNLAREQSQKNKKFFTIGVVSAMDDISKIEILFQALKRSLSVVPDLQFILVGDGKKRKNFLWLAKRMEINNLCWFVGHQEYLKKWFDGFDVFCCPQEDLNLSNMSAIMQALVYGLPVIGPSGVGLREFLDSNKQIITVDPGNAETLAQEIINIYKNKYSYKKIAKDEKMNELFSASRMAEDFDDLILMM